MIMSSDRAASAARSGFGLAAPAHVDSPAVRALIDDVYGLMTMRPVREVVAGRHAGRPCRLPPARDRPSAISRRCSNCCRCALQRGGAGYRSWPKEADCRTKNCSRCYERFGLAGLAQVDKGDITLTALGLRYVQGAGHCASRFSDSSCWPRCAGRGASARLEDEDKRELPESLSSNCWRIH